MNFPESNPVVHSSLTARVLAVAVGVLLIASFAVTIGNMTTISNQVTAMKDGPCHASLAAGRVETMLVQLKTLAEQSDHMLTADETRILAATYEEIDTRLTSDLVEIHENEFSPSEADELVSGYSSLRDLQATLLESHESSGDRELVKGQIISLIDSLLTANAVVLESTNRSIDEISSTVDNSINQTISISCLLITGGVIALISYAVMLYARRKQEKRLQQDLETALEEAQKANLSKTTFLSNISHDIRTPLNAIIGLTAIANAHPDDPDKLRECLSRVGISSRNLLSLINDVLDMRKIESGKITLNEERFSLPRFVLDFIVSTKPQAHMKDLSFSVDIGRLSQDVLIGDAMRLNKILTNLVSNAIKYTPEEGSIFFALSEVRHDDQGFNYYRFSIEDTGIGMEADFIDRIFEPFAREENAATKTTEGSGLGMSIAKEMLDLMGGDIEIESKPNEGSLFTVIIPLKIPDSSSVPCDIRNLDELRAYCARGSRALGSHPSSKPAITGRVLLVEDNSLNQEIAAELITSLGAVVETADDGVDAVNKIKSSDAGRYDLIFMDWQMPRMDGLEATKEIISYEKEKGIAHTPIVAMTANAFSEERSRALSAGMDGFMVKPIEIDKLDHYLRLYLRSTAPSAIKLNGR